MKLIVHATGNCLRRCRTWGAAGLAAALLWIAGCTGETDGAGQGVDGADGTAIRTTSMGAAQAPEFPQGTIVARFELPAAPLVEVTTSAELIEALRAHLTLDLAMPLDEPLQVDLRGMAGGRGGDGPPYYFTLSPLGVRYTGTDPLNDFPYAEAVRESHGDDFPPDGDAWDEYDADDWHEDEAWARLVEALDVGLPQSAAGFGQPEAEAHVALRVRGVHLREFTIAGPEDDAWVQYGECCAEEFDNAVLQLRPEVSFQSAVMGGPDSETARNLTVLVIELVAETSR